MMHHLRKDVNVWQAPWITGLPQQQLSYAFIFIFRQLISLGHPSVTVYL